MKMIQLLTMSEINTLRNGIKFKYFNKTKATNISYENNKKLKITKVKKQVLRNPTKFKHETKQKQQIFFMKTIQQLTRSENHTLRNAIKQS